MAVVELTQQNFESTLTGNKIVIVDFRAPWCGRAPRLVSRRPVCGSGVPGAASRSLDRS
jgi:thiol-disulfide isomerase/thioredoxin